MIKRLLARLQVLSLVNIACVLGLLAIALMVWSVLDPTPFPVMISMSVGMVIGTLSLLSYICAVLLHTVRTRAARKSAVPPAP